MLNLFTLVAKLVLDKKEFEDGLDDEQKKAGGFGSALKKAAKIGGAAIVAAKSATVAFAKSAIDAGSVFDKSMSQVAATMGYSVNELNDAGSEAAKTFKTLGDFAQEMGRTTAFSASEAADALNYMALAGYDAETSMKALPNVLNLAAAGNIDLARASDMVTDAQSALGLSLEETSALVDMMAAASSKSNTSVAQLGDAILTIGATARSVAGGTKELSTVLGVLADNGIKGAEGGTHLRNMILSLQNPTDDGAAALEKLGISVYDSSGNMRSLISIMLDLQNGLGTLDQKSRDAMLNGIFNKTDLAAVNALLGTSATRFRDLGIAIASGQTLDNILSEEGIREIQERFTELFTNVGGDVESFSEKAKKYISESFDVSDTVAQNAIDTFIDSMNNGVTSAEELYSALASSGSAAQAMAETQLDNLAGDITLFKSALEGAKIAVSNGLTPSLREFVKSGTEGLSQVTAAFQKGGFTDAIDSVGSVLSDGLTMILSWVPTFLDAGMQLLGAIGEGIVDNAPVILDAAVSIVFTLAEGLIDAIPELIPAVVEIILAIVEKLTEPDMVTKLIQAAFQIIGAIEQGLIDAIPKLVEAAPTIMLNLIESLLRFLPQMLASGGQLIAELALGILRGGVGVIDACVNVFVGAKDAFLARIEEAKQWGKDLIQNFIDGITAKWEALKDKVSGVASTVKKFLGFSEPEEGPLSDFHTYAPDMMELFAKGIRDNADIVENELNRALDFDVKTKVPTQGYAGTGGGDVDGWISVIVSAMREALAGVGIYLDTRKVGEIVAKSNENLAMAWR